MQKTPALWRQILRQNFIHIDKLTDFLSLTDEQKKIINDRPKFNLNLPFRLASKIAKGNLEDPILRQFVPLIDETIKQEGFSLDPVCDKNFRKESKLLHKYEGRALLVCTSACAMHCRYCFRQNFDYDTKKTLFEDEISIIKNDVSIKEILLSGGDPLSLDNNVLKELLSRIDAIDHIKRVRFHTRFPIGIPERIDEEFLNILKALRVQVWFVIHSNHAIELDADVLKALKNIQRLGIPVLNQSVLLKGVNDDMQTLKELNEKLVDNGILPYYLHQLDKVEGASHFEVDQQTGKKLINELTKTSSGYAVPKYVQEIPGAQSKTLIL